MKLTSEQIKTFDEQGYLFFPNCFTEEEVALLRSEADNIFRTNRQEVWREKAGAPRTAFAAHTYNEAFRLMAHHPRLVEPLQQLFGEGVYVHQFKINAKAAFEGDVWQWQCAPKARIISGGGFHPDSCRLIRKLASGSVGGPAVSEPRDKGRLGRLSDPAGR